MPAETKEETMPQAIDTPYHLSPQSASALLRPIDAALRELEIRLTQYVERIPMPDADRELVARARESVARDRERVAALVEESTRLAR